MKKHATFWGPTIVCVWLAFGNAARGQSVWQAALNHMRHRVEAGTRMTAFRLSDTQSVGADREAGETFLGNINQLDDVQDYAPTKLFLAYFPIPYAGLELTGDRVEANVRNANNDFSDGSVCMSGPIITLIGRYPNRSVFTPYAGVGLAMWNADFKVQSWWRYGYDSPESWEAAGSPEKAALGVKKRIEVQNATGIALLAGSDIRVYENWSVDVMMRSIDIDADAHYYRNKELRRTGSLPLDHVTYGIGVRYTFF